MLELLMVGDDVSIGGARCVLEVRVGPRVVVLRRSSGEYSLGVLGAAGWKLDPKRYSAKALTPATERALVVAGCAAPKKRRRKKR